MCRFSAGHAAAVVFAVVVGYSGLRASMRSWAQRRHADLVVNVNAVLQECGVTHYIDDGTLLGVYRDGGVILGDTDVDVMLTSWAGRQKLLECARLQRPFDKHNYRFDGNRNRNGGIKVSDSYGFYCDIDTAVEEQHTLRCVTLPYCQPGVIETLDHARFCRINKTLVEPLDVALFRGAALPVPGNTRAFLELKYGATWATPAQFDKGADTNPWDTFKSKIGWVVEVVFIVKYAYAWVRTDWPITLLVLKLGLAALAIRQVWLAFPHSYGALTTPALSSDDYGNPSCVVDTTGKTGRRHGRG